MARLHAGWHCVGSEVPEGHGGRNVASFWACVLPRVAVTPLVQVVARGQTRPAGQSGWSTQLVFYFISV